MSTAVVGFDVGSLTSYIGAAKCGGIEILANEVSDRCTPSCVSFHGSSRFLGAAAEQQTITNAKNTITSFTRLLGKMESDPIINTEREHAMYDIVADNQGRAAVKILINDESTVLLPEQILAMQFHKLVEVAEAHFSSKVVDVVVNVPTYYTDRERRAVLDATRIAGLNCMRLINETTAVGLAYGLTKKDLPAVEEPPKHVVFVSLGNSNLQVSVSAFNYGKMKVLSTACDPCLGGRDFDMVIFHHMVEEIKHKYKLKIMSNLKARGRLLKSCEKLKKVMSSNSTEIPLNVECIMEDTDVSSSMKREFFETLCAPLLERIKFTMTKALIQANLKPADIFCVELVGGSTRIPSVKQLVMDVFGQEGSTTLNADEAVARGCVLQAAICSPAFKVREFSIIDACPYSISLHWKPTEEFLEAVNDEDAAVLTKGTTMEVFKHLASFPSSKQLKFYRKSDFSLVACYSCSQNLHIPVSEIGTFQITNIVPTPPDNLCQVRVKARMNSNGIFTISNAVIMERFEKEVEVPIEEITNVSKTIDETTQETLSEANSIVPPEAPVPEAMTTNDSPAPAKTAPVPEKPKTRTEIKVVLRPRDVPVNSTTSQLAHNQLLEFTDFQAKLDQHDKIERERQNIKNSLEEYVYEMRSKLENKLSKFVTANERDEFLKVLTETEDWIYADGDDAKRSVLSQKYESLTGIGKRYLIRMQEFEARPGSINALSVSCETVKHVLDSYSAGDPAYEHLKKEDMEIVDTELKAKQLYLNKFLEKMSKSKQHEDPHMFVNDLYKAKSELETRCKPIISRPKPAPPVIEPKPNDESTTPADSNGTAKTTPSKDASKAVNGVNSSGEAKVVDEDMDVD